MHPLNKLDYWAICIELFNIEHLSQTDSERFFNDLCRAIEPVRLKYEALLPQDTDGYPMELEMTAHILNSDKDEAY